MNKLLIEQLQSLVRQYGYEQVQKELEKAKPEKLPKPSPQLSLYRIITPFQAALLLEGGPLLPDLKGCE